MRRTSFVASAILLANLACADEIMAPTPDDAQQQPRSAGWMSATANGESFNTVFVTVNRYDDAIAFEGLTWFGEDQLMIKLWVRTDVGVGVQDIGMANVTAANVIWRPAYHVAQGWTAYGTSGAGSVTLTSLTADRATGTFSFTARALSPAANPQDYRVTNGTFNVTF